MGNYGIVEKSGNAGKCDIAGKFGNLGFCGTMGNSFITGNYGMVVNVVLWVITACHTQSSWLATNRM